MIDYSISGDICILRLNNPPLNAINFQLLEALTAAIKRAHADTAVQGIIITGSDDHFSAGADVTMFEEIKTPEEAKRMSRVFQEAFDEVENSRKPVVAAVAGAVFGGALELAMACHCRVCAQSARLGMSEVKLGINPGAGGTQRLPRLIGLEAALEMLLTGRPINADDALGKGLVDVVCSKDRLIEAGRSLLQSCQRPVVASKRIDKISDKQTNEKAFGRAQRLVQSMRPGNSAPLLILEAVATGCAQSSAAGLYKEQEAFARCIDTPAARSLIYLFFATRKTGKIPDYDAIVPQAVDRVAVIGMGTMGSGIAQAFAVAGKSAVVFDAEARTVEKAIEGIKASLGRKIKRGSMTRQQADSALKRLSPVGKMIDIGPVDLVIEAIFENIEVKQSLFEQISTVFPEKTIIASNTSTIDLDVLAAKLAHPKRLIGLHFFNPAHSMPLVEVVQCKTTDPATVAAAMKCMKDLHKTPILVKNSIGFAVNRIFIPYFMEAFQLLQEGASAGEIDDAMTQFGFAMGPLATIDMTGIDILAMTDCQMQAAFPYHLPLPAVVRELTGQGLLGQKTGSGVYKYEKGDTTAKPSDQLPAVCERVRREYAISPRAIGPGEITDRLVLRLVGEAFHVVEEKIAQRESDIDVASVLAAGFPDFRGGVLKYADELGINTIKTRLDTLAGRLGDRFRPCSYLLNKIGE